MPIFQYGIDVSRYQGNINWSQVAASGKQFAIVRLGSSNNNGPYVDPYFKKNVEGAHSAGMRVGAYYYTYANTRAKVLKELDTFLPSLAGLKLEYPVFVDVEESSLGSLGRSTLTSLVRFAMDTMYERGFFPGWYTYTYFVQSYLNPANLEMYPFWIADYRGYVGYSGAWSMWQYSSTGSVPGISGACDLNYAYADYLPQIVAAGKNGYTANQTGPLMEEVTGQYIESISPNAEYFYTASIYDIVGYLPMGLYRVLSVSLEPYNGFNWVTFVYNGGVYWAALTDDRVKLVRLDTGDNEELIAELEAQIAALEAQIAALEAQIAALEEQIEDLESGAQTEALKQQIQFLQGQVEEFQGQVTVLEQKIAAAQQALE